MEKATWNQFLAQTWGNYPPPIRPYQEELVIIKQLFTSYIEKKKLTNPKVLILGSTPELRDIVWEFNIVPTVMDYSSENYNAMGILCKNYKESNFVELNWLDMNFVEEFDIVLSEAAFNVISSESANVLYEKIFKSLKINGLLIAKNWIRFNNKRPFLNDLINEFRCSSNAKGFYSHTCIPLMLCFYNYGLESIELKKFSQNCMTLFNDGKINEEEWNTISIHNYENVDLQLYIPIIYDFIKDISPYFSIKNIVDIKVAYSEYHPLFILEKNI